MYLFKEILILVFRINFANFYHNSLLPKYKNLKNFSPFIGFINLHQYSKFPNQFVKVRNSEHYNQNLIDLSTEKVLVPSHS